jgi:signal transduction histidine kinase
MMPGLDGFALIEALRADPATASIPVLLVSARTGEEATEQALAAGAADYVVKPFSARELVARVQVQLTQTRLARAERAARELAEQESRAREQFLAVLAHELRTPVSAVLGWTELLRTRQLGPDDTCRALAVIEQSTSMQRRLIEDLFDVSRIVSGRLTILEHHIDSLAPYFAEVLDSFRLAAAEKGVRIEATIESIAGPLCGDVERLQQVATNLLGNAIKFTPASGVVRVHCVRRDGTLELTVSDTGKGILADALPHVFDDFWMASDGAGRRGGLGLGLAISRAIVTLHGGTIGVESEGEGRGATFTVRLPLAVS